MRKFIDICSIIVVTHSHALTLRVVTLQGKEAKILRSMVTSDIVSRFQAHDDYCVTIHCDTMSK